MTKKQIRLLKALGVDFSDQPVQNVTPTIPDSRQKANQALVLGQSGLGAAIGGINGYLLNSIAKNRAYKRHCKYAKKHGLTPMSWDAYQEKHPGLSHGKAALIGAGIGAGIGALGQNQINKTRDYDYLQNNKKNKR